MRSTKDLIVSHPARTATVCLLVTIAICGAAFIYGPHEVGATAANGPYYLERQFFMQPPGSTEMVRTATEIMARDGQGALARVWASGRSDDAAVQAIMSGAMYRRELTLPSGVKLRIHDAFRMKSTYPTASNTPTPDPRSVVVPDCAGTGTPVRVLSREIVRGLNTVKVRFPITPDSIEFQWRAPAAGCEAVQGYTQVLQPDGSTLKAAEMRLVKLQLGEPDARLFDVGAAYAEVRPSESGAAQLRALGRDPEAEDQKLSMRNWDREYYARNRGKQ
jgi:hypothetical protein